MIDTHLFHYNRFSIPLGLSLVSLVDYKNGPSLDVSSPAISRDRGLAGEETLEQKR
jgi:hypothetical protein